VRINKKLFKPKKSLIVDVNYLWYGIERKIMSILAEKVSKLAGFAVVAFSIVIKCSAAAAMLLLYDGYVNSYTNEYFPLRVESGDFSTTQLHKSTCSPVLVHAMQQAIS